MNFWILLLRSTNGEYKLEIDGEVPETPPSPYTEMHEIDSTSSIAEAQTAIDTLQEFFLLNDDVAGLIALAKGENEGTCLSPIAFARWLATPGAR